ncbi:TPA: hypothetical protein ACUFCP_004376, partial [Escherichia coli]
RGEIAHLVIDSTGLKVFGDNQDVYHQPSSVFFVIKPSAWGKPRIN